MARLFKSFASIFVLSTFLYFTVNSCTDQNLASPPAPNGEKNRANGTADESVVVSIFSSNVGAPIDRATAIRWIGNFTNSNKGASSEYVIPVSILKSILSNTSCVGIVLYYALDDLNELHIIPIGVTGAGKVIPWKNIMHGGTIISWQTAWQWINNYSGSLRSHFFGSEILVSTYLQTKNLRLSRAINDIGAPQLLLSDASINTPQNYSDESRPCPPFCVTN